MLVHCVAGVSRSSSVALGFLMKHRGFSFVDALQLVKSKRPAAYPNPAFTAALLEIEYDVRGANSLSPAEVLGLVHKHGEGYHMTAVPHPPPPTPLQPHA